MTDAATTPDPIMPAIENLGSAVAKVVDALDSAKAIAALTERVNSEAQIGMQRDEAIDRRSTSIEESITELDRKVAVLAGEVTEITKRFNSIHPPALETKG